MEKKGEAEKFLKKLDEWHTLNRLSEIDIEEGCCISEKSGNRTKVDVSSDLQEFISAITDVFSNIEKLLNISRPLECAISLSLFETDVNTIKQQMDKFFKDLDNSVKLAKMVSGRLENYLNTNVVPVLLNKEIKDYLSFEVSTMASQMAHISDLLNRANKLKDNHGETYDRIRDAYFEALVYCRIFLLNILKLKDSIDLSAPEFQELSDLIKWNETITNGSKVTIKGAGGL